MTLLLQYHTGGRRHGSGLRRADGRRGRSGGAVGVQGKEKECEGKVEGSVRGIGGIRKTRCGSMSG